MNFEKILQKVKNDKIRFLLKEFLLPAAVLGILIVLLEVFVFNYRHWQSVGNKPVDADYTVSTNLSPEDENAYKVTSEEMPYLEVDGLDLQVQNIAMDFILPEEGATAIVDIAYHLEVIDQGNKNRYEIPGNEFLHMVPQSHYCYPDFYGNARNIRLCFDNLKEGTIIRIEYLIFNSIVPLMLSKKRMLVLFAFAFMLFLLRPKSFLYNYSAGKKSRVRLVSTLILLAFEIAFAWWGMHLNGALQDPQSDSERQYALLAEALAQGKPYLLVEPPQEMLTLEDPYDHAERIRVCGDENVLWDTAYFNGHYYVYFGVAPIILFYLPYFLLTGTHIKTVLVVFICSVAVMIAIALLLKEIMERYFALVPLPVYLILTAIMTSVCGLLYLIMKPDFYAVPLSMAMALCFLGLFCWLKSIGEEKIRIGYAALGSFCMALEAAVRPQFLLASFLAILLFWDAVFVRRTLFSKKGIGATVALIVPYVIIAAGVMYYNAVRFGSPFDFGANYNLTFNNMPYRGFHLDRLLNGTVGFLFTPCTVTNRFPYYDVATFFTTYQGPTADEALMGGFIYNHAFMIVTLMPFLFKNLIPKKKMYLYMILAPIASLIVMFTDANMAGVLIRYTADFAWYLLLSFAVIVCAVITELKDNNCVDRNGQNGAKTCILRQKLLTAVYAILMICLATTMIKGFLFLFAGDANPKENLTLVWHTVMHLVEFWH